MSSEIKKGGLLVKQILAKLKGDDKEALAAKIARKAVSAVDAQLAALNSKKVDTELEIEEAEEQLESSIAPEVMINDNQRYINNIKTSQEVLDKKKEQLEDINTSIKYFTELQSKF